MAEIKGHPVRDSARDSLSSGGAVFVPGEIELTAATMKVISVAGELFHRHSDFNPVDAVIMMVDDELLNIEMTQAFLEEAGYRNFVSTHESEHAIRLMREKRPHVLLLDLSMPKVSGMDILARMRDDEQLRVTPVIVLTSNNDAQARLKALGLGAMDFLPKPVDPSELALRLRNTLAARAHRDYLANYDGLTGLQNRMRYKAAVEAALAAAAKGQHGCALLHVGVDGLSKVNDALGRAAGDALLFRIARRLRQAVESADLGPMFEQQPGLYRFDGDEFAIVVPYLDEIESAAGLINSIMEACAVNFRAGDREVFATASLGITVFPLDGRAADELISNAGVAMRHAKLVGRNTYEFFAPELNVRAISALRIGGDLRRAISRDELTLRYEPRLDVKTGRLMSAEAVVRWTQPGGRVIEGDRILQAVSTSDMALVLGEWLIEAVMAQAKAWTAEGTPVVPVGVNLSMKYLPAAQLVELVTIALRDGKAAWLCLELHDLTGAPDPEAAVRATVALREMGVRVAMDNFGTPGATLSHLCGGWAVDEIKLDGAFTPGLEDKGVCAGIIQSMVQMAGALKVASVVTGVDSMRQLAILKGMEAAQYQGPLAGKPMAGDEFAAKYLKAGKG